MAVEQRQGPAKRSGEMIGGGARDSVCVTTSWVPHMALLLCSVCKTVAHLPMALVDSEVSLSYLMMKLHKIFIRRVLALDWC